VKSRKKAKTRAQAVAGSDSARRILGSALWTRYLKDRTKRLEDLDRKYFRTIATRVRRAMKQEPSKFLPAYLKTPADLKKLSRKRVPASKGKGGPPAGTPLRWPPGGGGELDYLFLHQGNFSFGVPDPQFFSATTPSDFTYFYPKVGSTQIAEYADPLQGYVSLAMIGGDFHAADGSMFSASPMPQVFEGMFDGISASASVFQTADISAIKQKTNIIAVSSIRCPINSGLPLQNLTDLIPIQAGVSSSAMSGLVHVAAQFILTVSSTPNGKTVSSNTNTTVLMGLAYNCTAPDYSSYNLLWDECVFTAPETMNETTHLATTFQIGGMVADQLIVEAGIRLVGLRGGINDPGAGWIGAQFANYNTPQVKEVAIGSEGFKCPFQILSIGALIDSEV
jgi:hypothetical protein